MANSLSWLADCEACMHDTVTMIFVVNSIIVITAQHHVSCNRAFCELRLIIVNHVNLLQCACKVYSWSKHNYYSSIHRRSQTWQTFRFMPRTFRRLPTMPSWYKEKIAHSTIAGVEESLSRLISLIKQRTMIQLRMNNCKLLSGVTKPTVYARD